MTIQVDYPRDSHYSEHGATSIIVPPFHTGPVGLLPETEVHVSLTEGEHGLEVLMRPYPTNPGNLARLTCTMTDEPGVVGALVDAISKLNINIVNHASAVTDHLNHHSVVMLLDWWSASDDHSMHYLKPSWAAQRQAYRRYSSVFPLMAYRYVRLFETIIENCGGAIVREQVDGIELPRLLIEELATPPGLFPGIVTVNGFKPKPYHVEIELPQNLSNCLRSKLGVTDTKQPLRYLLLSEADSRTLRAFFPRPKLVRNIVHLAFFHRNIPGAFGCILRPLAVAKFNIWESLIRPFKQGMNVLEVVLEYRGGPPPPPKSEEGSEALCDWAAELIARNLSKAEADRLIEANLEIGLPRYPKRKKEIQSRRIEDILKKFPPTAREVQQVGIPTSGPDSQLAALVRENKDVTKPTIFISYSSVGEEHVKLIEGRLEKHYNIYHSLEQESEIGARNLWDQIERCDCFISIWFDKTPQSQKDQWWNLVVAAQKHKNVILLHRRDLDPTLQADSYPTLQHEDDPNFVRLEFSDLTFQNEVLPKLEDQCKKLLASRSTVGQSGVQRLIDGENSQLNSGSDQSSLAENRSRRLEPSGQGTVQEPSSKAELARRLIGESGDDGLTAGELYTQLEKRDPSATPQYTYSLIRRLKTRGQIEEAEVGSYGKRRYVTRTDDSL